MRLALAVLPLLVGCYATKVMRVEALVPTESVPALMVSTIVETTENDTANEGTLGLAQVVLDLKNNVDLDTFGVTVQPAVTTWLTTQGIGAHADKDRVMVDKKTDWAAVLNEFTVLSGTWVDPTGLPLRVATDTLFAGATFRKVAEGLDGPEAREAYTYTTVTVVPQHEWLFVGVPRVLVHDQDGNPLVRASAWGKGNKTAFIVDRSPESLERAFAEAMGKIAVAEVEALPVK